MSEHEQPLPYRYYFVPVCLLTAAGFMVSLYLSISHYRVYTDIAYSSFCAISKAVNCDTVSQSSHSILWGIPVPVWGAIGYVFLLLLLPYASPKNEDRKDIWSTFFITVLGYSLYSLYLAAVSSFIIHSYCLMCIVTYGINFSLLFYSWIIIKRFNGQGIVRGVVSDMAFLKDHFKTTIPVFSIFLASVVILVLTFNDYWNLKMVDTLTNIPTGITEGGHPWIGAETPEMTIVEYNDYLCFQCKKMHYFLRSMITKNPERLRLVHMHFPIDKKYNPFIKEDLHPGSGEMSMLAIYAGFKGKFWEMNDLLFQIDRTKDTLDVTDIAETLDFSAEELGWALQNKEIRLLLKRDIAIGVKSGVSGTPSYVIDGQTYEGNIPGGILSEFIAGSR